MQEQTYFANLPQEEIAAQLYAKVTDYYEKLERTGKLELYSKIHRYYFALNQNGRHEAVRIQRAGEQGEMSMLKANHYRNLLTHLHVLVTQQRPAFDCRAINTDYKSQIQTILGKNILEYYLREQRLDLVYREAAEMAITYAESYIEYEWDDELGDDVAADPETGERIKTGDIRARVYGPVDVVRQWKATKSGRLPWYILRTWENRYELAARYPEHADAILSYQEETPDQRFFYHNQSMEVQEANEDMVPVYTLYHDRTVACKEGRVVRFMGNETVLKYDILDYPEMPVYCMMPARQHDTSFGYSVSFDLLCVQEAIDALYSTITTNQLTFGVQNIWVKPGSNLNTNQLAGGLNVFESNEKPEPINLTNTPAEIFKFLQGLEQLGEVLSGVNSVARGQPEASLKSGSALALVASQAVQFSNGLQAAYARLLEDSGTCILRTLQTRATLPRATVIAGKNNKSYMKEFTGDELGAINRVIVDLGNPVSRTLAGRVEMARDLLQAQVIKSPEEYVMVVETGNVDPMINDEKSEQLLIDAENEAIREGRPVTVIAVDQHVKHIVGHKQVLADPSERQNPQVVQAALAHIQEHITALQQTDPQLLNVLGMQSLAPAAPMNQGQNAPQPNAKPQPGDPVAPGEQVQPPTGMNPEQASQLPQMPELPPGAPQ
jgi:hypothetical protein